MSEEGRVHSSEGDRDVTKPSMPCCPCSMGAYFDIFIIIVITVWHGIGDFFVFREN